LALAPASRADASGGDAALAEALFREGKQLMAAGRHAEACPKLAESQRLDPGGGTLLTLALCHEAEGKTASAWVELRDALAQAHKEGRADRAAIAEAHVQALEPRLARLAVDVRGEAAQTPGLVVRRDGVTLTPPAWGVAVPVDPGPHVVEAEAPARRPFRREVPVGDGARVAVEVPVLPAPGAPDAPPLAPLPAPRPFGALAVAGLAAGALGLAALGAGAIAGMHAGALDRRADAKCPGILCADPGAVADSHAAGQFADASTATVIAGGVVLGAGVVMFVVARASRGPRRASFAIAPIALGRGAGVAGGGAW
jgi:hypothetical protein